MIVDAAIFNQSGTGRATGQKSPLPGREPNSVDQGSVEAALHSAAFKIGWAACGCGQQRARVLL